MSGVTDEIASEALKHFATPKNYGEMADAVGVGIGYDSATSNYATIYLKLSGQKIENAKYVAHGSEDIVILGSIFTEMIEGDSLQNAIERAKELEKEVQAAYDAIEPPKVDLSKPEGEQVEAVSTESQDAANIVLTAFKAAVRHIERKEEGIVEDHFKISIAKRCPYSNSDCALSAH
ncbi:MAG: iron-sulfur cluster assembly scaffold protein [Hydrogenimonas sp.]|nr:iron-sulfur cluster assembly scaffold protein [Hydrogenimonas sp.]